MSHLFLCYPEKTKEEAQEAEAQSTGQGMRMQKEYRTVYQEATFIYEEKRSRFIARVLPVRTEEEAIGFINRVRSESRDATHHCYAYYIEGDTTYQRYSDDGEPAGTAGIPILEVIKKRQLVNIVIVVVRYFGGILLGAGGLVRAYGKAAAGGVLEAREIRVKSCVEAKIYVEYHLSGKLQNMLLSEGFILGGTEYSDRVTFKVLIDENQKGNLEEKVSEITGGKACIAYCGHKLIKMDESNHILEIS
ncbi:MAG TPA: YigZ family protein [Thermoclostridium caenicola]|nr:YigZ family protein [Thermoclostridium caenicola]